MRKTVDSVAVMQFNARTQSIDSLVLREELSENSVQMVKEILRAADRLGISYLDFKKAIIMADDRFYDKLISK